MNRIYDAILESTQIELTKAHAQINAYRTYYKDINHILADVEAIILNERLSQNIISADNKLRNTLTILEEGESYNNFKR
jgi:hypothetical protein